MSTGPRRHRYTNTQKGKLARRKANSEIQKTTNGSTDE